MLLESEMMENMEKKDCVQAKEIYLKAKQQYDDHINEMSYQR